MAAPWQDATSRCHGWHIRGPRQVNGAQARMACDRWGRRPPAPLVRVVFVCVVGGRLRLSGRVQNRSAGIWRRSSAMTSAGVASGVRRPARTSWPLTTRRRSNWRNTSFAVRVSGCGAAWAADWTLVMLVCSRGCQGGSGAGGHHILLYSPPHMGVLPDHKMWGGVRTRYVGSLAGLGRFSSGGVGPPFGGVRGTSCGGSLVGGRVDSLGGLGG